MDSAAAIDRIRSDTLGPVQRFAAASIEVCSRTLGRKKRRHGPLGAATPGHRGQRGGGQICQCRGRGGSPADAVPNDYRREPSLSYMTRAFAETKNRATAQWIADHVKPERKYSPPPPERMSGESSSAEHESRYPDGISSLCQGMRLLAHT